MMYMSQLHAVTYNSHARQPAYSRQHIQTVDANHIRSVLTGDVQCSVEILVNVKATRTNDAFARCAFLAGRTGG